MKLIELKVNKKKVIEKLKVAFFIFFKFMIHENFSLTNNGNDKYILLLKKYSIFYLLYFILYFVLFIYKIQLWILACDLTKASDIIWGSSDSNKE